MRRALGFNLRRIANPAARIRKRTGKSAHNYSRPISNRPQAGSLPHKKSSRRAKKQMDSST